MCVCVYEKAHLINHITNTISALVCQYRLGTVSIPRIMVCQYHLGTVSIPHILVIRYRYGTEPVCKRYAAGTVTVPSRYRIMAYQYYYGTGIFW